MEKYEYKEVLAEVDSSLKSEHPKTTWKPLLRQCIICIALWSTYFVQGLYLGAPTVLKAQMIRDENVTISEEMSSWLSSTPVFSAAPWVCLLPWLFFRIGRKFTFFIVCCLGIIGFIIFYMSTNLYHILMSQVFLGAITGAASTLTPIIITEYTSPKYRGFFLTMKSASSFWGIWCSNAIGTFCYWKNIAMPAFICSAYMITVLAWPESPYWLAMKGRYAESAESHRWLKGVSESSEKELTELLNSQKNAKVTQSTNDVCDRRGFSCFASAWTTLTARPFYKPMLICVVLMAQYQSSGKFVISIYAIEILKKVTQDESLTYKYMLILDGVTVFSMYGGCILSRYCKRRTLMLLFTGSGIVFLYILSFYLYLVSVSIVNEHQIVIISLLTAYSIAIGCGPLLLVTSVYGEIVPSRYQSSIVIISGLYSVLIISVLLKLTPFLVRIFTIGGYFFFFAVSSTVVLIILYMYLPETKDKTMHEIEVHFVGQRLIK